MALYHASSAAGKGGNVNYFSVCDGIGAAHAALLPLGYRCVGVSEIDKYCNQLIEEKYGFKNYGDFTKKSEWTDWRAGERIDADLIIGGTPCTSFSIIGNKKGVSDPNGMLAFTFVSFVCIHKPQWFVWENVPNVLSIDDGGVFLFMLSKLSRRGYGLAWRVLNAQFFGVPQRRRRVFLVGCLGDPIRAGKVLFDTEPVQVPAQKLQKTECADPQTVARYFGNRSQAGTVMANYDKGMCSDRIHMVVIDGKRARKLTPLECERLMGFEDGYTVGFSNSQRYKMLGNSMPVPVIRWIGKRILESEVNQ
jgi:DNA (cytosine-5)-methyltransferase 1